jgi:MFS superfamily sulfate permease-like transporter
LFATRSHLTCARPPPHAPSVCARAALFTSAQYLQVGAVAIVSLLTNNTVTQIVAKEAAIVAALKSAASSATKAYNAQRGNPALAVLNVRATAAYNAANVELIQTQIDTASLLAFYVGIFSFGIGFLKLGNIMNLMGPAVISGFQTAASIRHGSTMRRRTRTCRRSRMH